MNDRILARLAQAAEQEQTAAQPRKLSGIFATPWLAGGFALAGALALLLAFALRPPHHPPAANPNASVELAEKPVSPQVPLAPIDVARHSMPRPSNLAQRWTYAIEPPANEPARNEVASFPAPEAPLTEQEKVLLHIARHPRPSDFALLNPEARDQIAQVSRADFNQFFPQPMPQETYYESQQPKP